MKYDPKDTYTSNARQQLLSVCPVPLLHETELPAVMACELDCVSIDGQFGVGDGGTVGVVVAVTVAVGVGVTVGVEPTQ